MGSYNLSCFVSGVTISPGDEIYFIPLRKRDKKYIPFHFFDVTELYIPASMPIKAIYDDYGNIIPEESEYTKVLINHFQGKYTLAQICDPEINLFDGGCYAHKEIYESLFIYLNDCNGKSQDNNNFTGQFNLWKKTIKQEFETGERLINLFKKGLPNQTNPDEIKYFEDEIQKYENRVKTFDFGFMSSAGFFSFDSFAGNNFKELKIYHRGLYEGTLNPVEIINFINFICNLHTVSKMLLPAVLGQQCGNPYMTKKLLNLSKKINQSKIRKVEK